MTPRPPDDRADELPPTEAARARRRDHDATAIGRKGMRTGLAKQFKQVLDAQVKRGRTAGAASADDAARAGGASGTDDVLPPPNGKSVPRRRRPGGDSKRP